MWQEGQSETARTLEILAYHDMQGDALYQKFRSASRENIRLAAALRGALMTETEAISQREAYHACLRTRIRPAIRTLIELDDLSALEKLPTDHLLSASVLDEAIAAAVEMRREEILFWLLWWKQEKYGFPDRDLSL